MPLQKEKARILAEKLEATHAIEMQLKEASELLQLQYDALSTENQALKIQTAKLESVVEVKNELIDRIMPCEIREDASD